MLPETEVSSRTKLQGKLQGMAITPKPSKRLPKAPRPQAVPKPHSQFFTKFVGRLQVKPRQQSRMSLGLFDSSNLAKGFCTTLTPDPLPGTVVTQIATPLGRMETYELTLQITNYGTEEIQAEVWQM